MQHFFVVPDQVRDGYIEITGSDVNHMKNVLRMKTGEQLEISDGNNKKYLCEIESLEADKVTAQILEEREAENELPSKIYLFQGLPKSDKMELIIQKAVELGAWEVIPVATKRAVVKLDQKKGGKEERTVERDFRERCKTGWEKCDPGNKTSDELSGSAFLCEKP